jgi:outer membrane protein OmpA-like peptidoglycan-associated protein
MATNLIDALQGLMTPQLLGAASSRLGESQADISKGLGAALPLLLGGLMQRGNDSSLMSQIMGLLTSPTNNPNILTNPASAFPGEPSSSGVADLANKLLSMLFGSRLGATTSALAEYAGIKNSSASSLMTLASTLITALLGDRVRRDGLSAAGLAGLLNGQRDSIVRALPGALSSVAGLGAVRDVARAPTDARPQGGLGWLWAVAAGLIVALLAWALMGRREAPDLTTPASDAARSAMETARSSGQAMSDAAQRAGQAASEYGQNALAKLGAFTTRRLPTNVELNVPERGVESQVIAYLGDPSKQVEPAVWFNFDRLLFETGSATLKPESQEQLKNVAEILKAYPSVKVKIGGYTDNTGNPEANLKLSQDRATNVRDAIVALGIAPERLSAEGFGEQFPVADNSTPEGRQENRRIALRVTEK